MSVEAAELACLERECCGHYSVHLVARRIGVDVQWRNDFGYPGLRSRTRWQRAESPDLGHSLHSTAGTPRGCSSWNSRSEQSWAVTDPGLDSRMAPESWCESGPGSTAGQRDRRPSEAVHIYSYQESPVPSVGLSAGSAEEQEADQVHVAVEVVVPLLAGSLLLLVLVLPGLKVAAMHVELRENHQAAECEFQVLRVPRRRLHHHRHSYPSCRTAQRSFLLHGSQA